MDFIAPSVILEHLVFINFFLPSYLLDPVVAKPFILERSTYRGAAFSYASIVLASFTEVQLRQTPLRLPRIVQMSYATYARCFGRRVIYFLHSYLEFLPFNVLKRFGLPIERLRARLHSDYDAGDDLYRRIEVRGKVGRSNVHLRIDRAPDNPVEDDPSLVENLTGRTVGVFKRKNGGFVYLKASHAPLYIQPARILSATMPSIPELPLLIWDLRYLSSVWLVRQASFKFHLGFSLGLKGAETFVRNRLRQV